MIDEKHCLTHEEIYIDPELSPLPLIYTWLVVLSTMDYCKLLFISATSIHSVMDAGKTWMGVSKRGKSSEGKETALCLCTQVANYCNQGLHAWSFSIDEFCKTYFAKHLIYFYFDSRSAWKCWENKIHLYDNKRRTSSGIQSYIANSNLVLWWI